MNRRSFLQHSSAFAGLGLAGLAGCERRASAPATGGVPALPFYDAVGPIVPIRAHVDRIINTTVCLRPFRAAGSRMDVERVGNTIVVHNYGHGGSGWSLSWGAAEVAAQEARDALLGNRDVAVIGCGALGLTAAITAQRMGMRVTIFTKERPPDVRSSRATGVWSPDSRIALTSAAAPEFGAARQSHLADDVQRRRLLAPADERLPDRRWRHRDQGVPVAAGCGLGAAEGGRQLPGVRGAERCGRTRVSCRCGDRSPG